MTSWENNDTVDENDGLENPKPNRPRMLNVICWLSGFNGIATVIQNIISTFDSKPEDMVNAASEMPVAENLKGQAVQYFSEYGDKLVSHNLSMSALYILGLIGVWEMYNLRKRGFFMYGVAHILITFYPMLLVLQNQFTEELTIQVGVVTAVFIGLYASQLKYMKDSPSEQ